MKRAASKRRRQNRAWNFFASVKLTVALLLSLAFTSIIGTLIPQNQPLAMYAAQYGRSLSRVLSFFDLTDMYHSWWFQLLILLMAVNICVCSMDRLSGTWKTVFKKKGSFNKNRFRKQAPQIEFEDKRSPKSLKEAFSPIVSKGFGFFKTEPLEDGSDGFVMLAEKRRWSGLGVYVAHLSILILLAGAMTGSILGFDGYANIPEGQETDVIRIRNSQKTMKLDFKIRCDDFDVSFYETGAPKEFRSKLSIIKKNKVSLSKDIIVNDPLRHRGVNIFQSSYGRIPSEEITLSFALAESGMMYARKTRMGEPVDIPEGMGTFTPKGFKNAYNFMGHNIGPSYTGIFKPKDREPVEVTLPLNFPSFDRMRRDKIIISVTGEEKLYYTGLQITSDPGIWLVYIGFIMMIVGFIISFFMGRQQIFVEVKRKGGKTRVLVAGFSAKNMLGMRLKAQTLSEKLKHA
jgi:cytochrome c biogenesis protein